MSILQFMKTFLVTSKSFTLVAHVTVVYVSLSQLLRCTLCAIKVSCFIIVAYYNTSYFHLYTIIHAFIYSRGKGFQFLLVERLIPATDFNCHWIYINGDLDPVYCFQHPSINNLLYTLKGRKKGILRRMQIGVSI